MNKVTCFGFRSFGELSRFEKAQQVLEASGDPVETYRDKMILILSENKTGYQVKMRGKKMKVRRLKEQQHGFARWELQAATPFPLSPETIKEVLFPALGLKDAPALDHHEYPMEILLADIILPHPDLCAVPVFKDARVWDFNDGKVELVSLQLNGDDLWTLGIRNPDADKLSETLRLFGMEGERNITYGDAVEEFQWKCAQ